MYVYEEIRVTNEVARAAKVYRTGNWSTYGKSKRAERDLNGCRVGFTRRVWRGERAENGPQCAQLVYVGWLHGFVVRR